MPWTCKGHGNIAPCICNITDGSDRSVSCPGCFITRKTVPIAIGQETGWFKNNSGQHEEEKNFYHSPESESWHNGNILTPDNTHIPCEFKTTVETIKCAMTEKKLSYICFVNLQRHQNTSCFSPFVEDFLFVLISLFGVCLQPLMGPKACLSFARRHLYFLFASANTIISENIRYGSLTLVKVIIMAFWQVTPCTLHVLTWLSVIQGYSIKWLYNSAWWIGKDVEGSSPIVI